MIVAVGVIGMAAAALAVAGAFALPTARGRGVAVLAVLVLTPLLLVADLAATAELGRVLGEPRLAAAAVAIGLGLAIALAAAFRRWPVALPVAAVAALPFRVPLAAGGETANLLVPLYLVIGAGGLAYAYDALRQSAARVAPRERRPGRVELALLAAVILYAVQSAYSSDFEQALKNVLFFYLPFALLLKLLAGVDWSRRVVTWSFGVLVALALLFAGVGFWEYQAGELLFNAKVIEANQVTTYFRVNSLFFDPNIYGRFIALVIIAVGALLLWNRDRREVAFATACLAILWPALYLTYSQSSFVALLAGLAVLAALRWGKRPVAVAVGAALAVAVLVVVAFPGVVKVDLRSPSALERATSGRSALIGGGIGLFADRPVGGHGSGSFAKSFRRRERRSSQQAATASHTTPITVAAEQGVLGLASYGLVLAAALALVFRGLGAGSLAPAPGAEGRSGADADARAGPVAARPMVPAQAAVAAAFVALLAHTLLYAGFLEDPIAWALLAAAVGLRDSADAFPEAPADAPLTHTEAREEVAL